MRAVRRMVCLLQQIESDVSAGKVVDGNVAALEEEHCSVAVDNGFAVEGCSDATRGALHEDRGFGQLDWMWHGTLLRPLAPRGGNIP